MKIIMPPFISWFSIFLDEASAILTVLEVNNFMIFSTVYLKELIVKTKFIVDFSSSVEAKVLFFCAHLQLEELGPSWEMLTLYMQMKIREKNSRPGSY